MVHENRPISRPSITKGLHVSHGLVKGNLAIPRTDQADPIQRRDGNAGRQNARLKLNRPSALARAVLASNEVFGGGCKKREHRGYPKKMGIAFRARILSTRTE